MVSRARLQLVVAWAHILLQHTKSAFAALNRFETALERADASDTTRPDLRAEADVLRAVAEMFADRAGSVDTLVAEAMSRPDTFHPRVPGVAGNVAAFAAVYRFEFNTAQRILEWAAPYQAMMGPFASVYALCFGGIAARYQLDIPSALRNFREAFEIGARVGPHSHAARLAGALLGELLYETGDLSEAARLLDESYQLGSEGGGVDYLAARYVIGARISATGGDIAAAIDRLAAGMEAAERLALPRLAAGINNERIRLGIAIEPAVAARLRAQRTIPRDDGISMLTAELDEDSGIRLLSASDSAADREEACRRASDLLSGIDGERRPLAGLRAELLFVETLTITGRLADANAAATAVVAQCEDLGLSRLLVDAGLR